MCPVSVCRAPDLPDWWVPKLHDLALLQGAVKHGLGNFEIMCLDEALPLLQPIKDQLAAIDAKHAAKEAAQQGLPPPQPETKEEPMSLTGTVAYLTAMNTNAEPRAEDKEAMEREREEVERLLQLVPRPNVLEQRTQWLVNELLEEWDENTEDLKSVKAGPVIPELVRSIGMVLSQCCIVFILQGFVWQLTEDDRIFNEAFTGKGRKRKSTLDELVPARRVKSSGKKVTQSFVGVGSELCSVSEIARY